MGHEPVVRQDAYKRLMRYEELRLSGLRPVDAIREIGLGDRSGENYERWYRKRHNLAPGRKQWGSEPRVPAEVHDIAGLIVFWK